LVAAELGSAECRAPAAGRQRITSRSRCNSNADLIAATADGPCEESSFANGTAQNLRKLLVVA
jgi:hypothetical protein